MMAVDACIVAFPEYSEGLAVLHSVLRLKDALDGAKARREAEDRGTETTTTGALIDSLSDRFLEMADSLTLAARANQEDDELGSLIHIGSGITSSWPSVFRAKAEAGGIGVPEGGIGTSTARVVTGIAALLTTKHPKISRSISAVSMGQNLLAANRRRQATDPDSPYSVGPLSDTKDIEAAQQRYPLLRQTALTTAAIGLRYVVKSRRK